MVVSSFPSGFPLAPPSSGRASPSSGGRRSEPQRHRRKFSDVSVTFQFLAPVSVLRCWSCFVDSYTACHLVTPSSSAPMAAARLGASSSFQLDEAEPALSSSSSSSLEMSSINRSKERADREPAGICTVVCVNTQLSNALQLVVRTHESNGPRNVAPRSR